jgi:hypothetical protein
MQPIKAHSRSFVTPAQIIVAKRSKTGPELGLVASARTQVRLNVVSPAVFPLPPCLQSQISEEIEIPATPESASADPELPGSEAGAPEQAEYIPLSACDDSLDAGAHPMPCVTKRVSCHTECPEINASVLACIICDWLQ